MDAPVYLFTGPEAGDRNEKIQQTIASLKKKFGEIEEYHFYASETPAAEFMTVLQNESLFASATCVIVKNADALKKKEDIEIIASWVQSKPAENSILILTSDEISCDTKLEKLIPKDNKKIFWEMFEDRKKPWIMSFFSKNGFTIQEEAAGLILDLVENNTEILRNECTRFFSLFPKDHLITEDDVEAIIAHTKEESAYTLFETMADEALSSTQRFEKCLEILQKIRLSKTNSSVAIITGLTFCFRKLTVWNKLKSEGKTDDFNLKINGISTSKKSKMQYTSASRIWTPGQAVAILADLAHTDMEIRSSGSLLEDVLLQKLLYEILIKKGATSASYDYSI